MISSKSSSSLGGGIKDFLILGGLFLAFGLLLGEDEPYRWGDLFGGGLYLGSSGDDL